MLLIRVVAAEPGIGLMIGGHFFVAVRREAELIPERVVLALGSQATGDDDAPQIVGAVGPHGFGIRQRTGQRRRIQRHGPPRHELLDIVRPEDPVHSVIPHDHQVAGGILHVVSSVDGNDRPGVSHLAAIVNLVVVGRVGMDDEAGAQAGHVFDAGDLGANIHRDPGRAGRVQAVNRVIPGSRPHDGDHEAFPVTVAFGRHERHGLRVGPAEEQHRMTRLGGRKRVAVHGSIAGRILQFEERDIIGWIGVQVHRRHLRMGRMGIVRISRKLTGDFQDDEVEGVALLIHRAVLLLEIEEEPSRTNREHIMCDSVPLHHVGRGAARGRFDEAQPWFFVAVDLVGYRWGQGTGLRSIEPDDVPDVDRLPVDGIAVVPEDGGALGQRGDGLRQVTSGVHREAVD